MDSSSVQKPFLKQIGNTNIRFHQCFVPLDTILAISTFVSKVITNVHILASNSKKGMLVASNCYKIV